MFHQHTLSIDFKQYRDFIFAFSMEKLQTVAILESQPRAAQQALIRVKPAGATIPANEMPDQMFITLLSESICEIKDLGLRVFD